VSGAREEIRAGALDASTGGEKSRSGARANPKSNPRKAGDSPRFLTKREKKERRFEIMELEWAKHNSGTWPRAEMREHWESMTPEQRKWFGDKNA
jgi:hypothetical protein